MNNNSRVADDSTSLRNVIAMPNTASARANDHMLRNHTAAVGYNTVAASIGSDKTQVCRFFTGERPVTLPQLLHWMDTVGIRFEAADENSEEGVLQDLIDQASAVSSLKCNTRLKVHDFTGKDFCWSFKVEAFARTVV